MLKLLFAILLFIHGALHFLGFAKAFHVGHVPQLSSEISRASGILWLATALLFVTAAVLLLAREDTWWIAALVATVVSQALIVTSWHDARYGSVANLIIGLVILAAFGTWTYERTYRKDAALTARRMPVCTTELVTQQDLVHLPEPLQRYLTKVGVLNQPKVKSLRVVMDGVMRQRGKDWFPFHAEQYNFFDSATRLFFMKARMHGISVPGYHKYQNGSASMDVKLFGLVPVAHNQGKDMNRAETVTLFNDMCFLAPATLIDKRIQWETLDVNSVKAVFTVNGIGISAILQFNQRGELINFYSDDRFEVKDKKYYRFATPVNEYSEINGYHLSHIVEACWQYPDGWFSYGKFAVREVEYNVK